MPAAARPGSPMPATPPRPPEDPRPALRPAGVAVLGFAIALASTTVVYPLLALDAGFSATAIGLFTSVSAAAQLIARLGLPWLLSRMPDRSIIGLAAMLMAVSGAVLLASVSTPAFVVAQVVQGVARALFWTASQTHVVRSPGIAVRRLAQVQMASHSGALIGPIVAGAVAARSLRGALALTILGAVVAALVTGLMARLEPYQRAPSHERRGTWRRSVGSVGNWSSFSAGGWRGLLDSFVPVVLSLGGLGAGTIGWLIAVSEAAHLMTAAAIARWGGGALRATARLAAGGLLASLVALPMVAPRPALAALALLLGGASGALVQTLGAALASSESAPSEQGTSLAVAGAYRAGSRMLAPSAVSGLAAVATLPVAMAIAAAGMVAPVLVLGPGRRATRPTTDTTEEEPA